MAFTFFTPSRSEILAVACPTCGAEPGEPCRRADGKTHAPRISRTRAVLSRLRTAQRDAGERKADDKAKRVARDWLRPLRLPD